MILSPVFCLHNGVVILDQKQTEISFGVVNIDDSDLCSRLEKAFFRFLKGTGMDASTSAIHFTKITKEICSRNVTKLFAADSLTHEKKSEETDVARMEDSPAVALLDSILHDALNAGATDIHIEGVAGHGVQVRFRVCGKLKEHIVFTEETAESLVLRIKNLAKLNTLEKRRPQDGQFTFARHTGVVSVRVSCISSIHGESVVLRLLDPSRIPLKPEKLGFKAEQLYRIYSLLDNSNGLILVCGPTGSGKSTTLASLLMRIQQQSGNTRKIVTIEDPVEYVLAGITQVQINNAISLDFDEMLRRIFRQDPDIIMLGEIRDKQTAAVAVSAALTGHLVFATLHTTGKDEAILRLKDLGVDEKVIYSILRGVISQRLVESEHGLSLQGDVSLLRHTPPSELERVKAPKEARSPLEGT
jgi:type II secretory ATPase GspE/PulE/Tfp pilus assembly ATPase PilB-like protein